MVVHVRVKEIHLSCLILKNGLVASTSKIESTSLADRLCGRIRSGGPITFAEWMRSALHDEFEGYYNRDRERWGRQGDYRTSPERSPLFAATFARYFARLYEQSSAPREWTLVEAGAGNGVFAAGVLQALQAFYPDVFSVTRYIIDEASRSSAAAAAERLHRFSERVKFDRIGEIRVDQGIVFSNELLDAFPVHRVVMRSGELRELYVDVESNGSFQFVEDALSSQRIQNHLSKFGVSLQEGQVAEVNLDIEDWLTQVAHTLRQGFLVTIDYGAETPALYDFANRPNGTLRAFKGHSFVDNVLASPGEQDLTTTINWSVVKAVGDELGFQPVDFASQDQFLIRAGLPEQLELLAARCSSESERQVLRTSAREMILPNSMASHFQVLVQQKCS